MEHKDALNIFLYTTLDNIPVWKKNRLYTIEEDEDGCQYVKRYKVTWKF